MPEFTLLAISYPDFDPVAVRIFGLPIRWYALAYVMGIVLGWIYLRKLAARNPRIMSVRDADDIVAWAAIGIVLGGRLGYVLFYKPGYYIENLGEVLSMWRGGMAFHGGLLGVILAIVVFSRVRKLNLFSVGDLIACVVPIGLFLGRLANFINGELWGRTTDVAWGMVFPTGGPLPRHPSQLYEAALEGLALLLVPWVLRRYTGALQRPGTLCGVFCCGYAAARFVVEFFRQPDAHLGYIGGFITMGQILSLPVLAFGLYLILSARRRPAPSAAAET